MNIGVNEKWPKTEIRTASNSKSSNTQNISRKERNCGTVESNKLRVEYLQTV